MGIEYIAIIAQEDCDALKMQVSTPLPREYDMWPPSHLQFLMIMQSISLLFSWRQATSASSFCRPAKRAR